MLLHRRHIVSTRSDWLPGRRHRLLSTHRIGILHRSRRAGILRHVGRHALTRNRRLRRLPVASRRVSSVLLLLRRHLWNGLSNGRVHGRFCCMALVRLATVRPRWCALVAVRTLQLVRGRLAVLTRHGRMRLVMRLLLWVVRMNDGGRSSLLRLLLLLGRNTAGSPHIVDGHLIVCHRACGVQSDT